MTNFASWPVVPIQYDNTGNNNDWLTELFANSPILSAEEIARSNKAAHAAHVAMVAAIKKESDAKKCGKCNGTGTVYFYAHHKGGECFRCGGTGRKAVA